MILDTQILSGFNMHGDIILPILIILTVIFLWIAMVESSKRLTLFMVADADYNTYKIGSDKMTFASNYVAGKLSLKIVS